MSSDNPILDWIDSQALTLRSRVIEWANINSGSYNLVGLARFAGLLRAKHGRRWVG